MISTFYAQCVMLSDSFSQDNLFAKNKVSIFFFQSNWLQVIRITNYILYIGKLDRALFLIIVIIIIKCHAKNQGKNIINTYDV